ncbi:glycosyltransferase family protein [Janibacter terrae]|uniref:hypothetical protein n=1 Tax=Janibacter terrae TaxID=103817 RepID=UPI00381789C1
MSKLLLLCNGSPAQTTAKLFTALAERTRADGHEPTLVLRAYPQGIMAKIRTLLTGEWATWRHLVNSSTLIVHTAMSLSLPSIVIAKITGKRVLGFVWDLYPESTRAAGNISNPLALWLYARTEFLGYLLADHLVVPSHDYTAALPQRFRSKCIELPLWTSQDFATPKSHNHGDTLNLAFAGQINGLRGLTASVARIIDGVQPSKTRLHVFSKDPTPPDLEKMVQHGGDLTVENHGFVDPKTLQAMLEDMDAGLVALDSRFTLPAYPSKITTYISAGIPVIYTGPSMPALEVMLRSTGVGISARDGVDLTQIRQLKDSFSEAQARYTQQISKSWDSFASLL